MKWHHLISATHGVHFSSKEQVEAWEIVIKKALPDLKKGEIEKALYEAMERDEKSSEYRLTSKDVIRWIRRSRVKWEETSYVRDGFVWFPDRKRICGQIVSRRATVSELSNDLK